VSNLYQTNSHSEAEAGTGQRSREVQKTNGMIYKQVPSARGMMNHRGLDVIHKFVVKYLYAFGIWTSAHYIAYKFIITWLEDVAAKAMPYTVWYTTTRLIIYIVYVLCSL